MVARQYESLSAKISLGGDMRFTKQETQRMRQAVAELKQEHRSLDITIDEMSDNVHSNQLEIWRFKRQKLKLKDAIARLESNLIPDWIA